MLLRDNIEPKFPATCTECIPLLYRTLRRAQKDTAASRYQMAYDGRDSIDKTAANNIDRLGLSLGHNVLASHDGHGLARFRAGAECFATCSLLLTVDEAAHAMRINVADLRHLINTKQLTSIIVADQELVPVRELVDFIDDYLAISTRSSL